MQAAALFARLDLRPDADEKDLRRAYARELKKIDQESQAEAFQALRETYEQLTWWLRRQKLEAQEAATDQPSGPEQVAIAQAPPDFEDTQPLETTAPADIANGPQAQTELAPVGVPNEALGQQVLELVIHRLANQPFSDRNDAAALLAQCLEDSRLTNVDARHYFEWGIASILASGWRVGHELLFAPAMECFGWGGDRSRLLWLGRPGNILDDAITELGAFDSQAAGHRELQRDVIRALRSEERPTVSELLKSLPVAEYVAATFPNWVHVISRPGTLTAWRRWDSEVPSWRRKLALRPRLRLTRITQAQPAPARKMNWGLVMMVFVVISALSRMFGSPSPPAGQPIPATMPPPPLYQPKPASLAPAVRVDDVLAPPRQQPAVQAADPAQGRKKAGELVKGKASPQLCREVAVLAREHPSPHARGEFGARFDRLVLDCLVKKMGEVPLAAVDASLERQRRRDMDEISRLIGSVRNIAPSPPTPSNDR